MFSNFQKRKLIRYFQFYDMDGNGYIERNDYVLFAKRLARVRGWAEGTASYEILMGRFTADWEILRSFADSSGDDRVSLDEWFAYHRHIYLIDTKYRVGENDIVGAIFETLDMNGDGSITEDEFKMFYSIYGLDSQLAGEVFRKLDENGDRVLTRPEIARLYRQFAHGDDPNALGNWLFGPF